MAVTHPKSSTTKITNIIFDYNKSGLGYMYTFAAADLCNIKKQNHENYNYRFIRTHQ